jgi:hypothetical protein
MLKKGIMPAVALETSKHAEKAKVTKIERNKIVRLFVIGKDVKGSQRNV